MERHLNLISQKSSKTGFVSSIDFPPVFEGLFPICHPYSTPWGWVTWIFSTPLHSSVPIVRTAEKHATNRRERWQKTLLSKAALLTIIDQLELSWKIHVAHCPAHFSQSLLSLVRSLEYPHNFNWSICRLKEIRTLTIRTLDVWPADIRSAGY